MSVSGVNDLGSVRVDQVQSERRAEDARAVEKRRARDQEDSGTTRRASESGRGENMDVTA